MRGGGCGDGGVLNEEVSVESVANARRQVAVAVMRRRTREESPSSFSSSARCCVCFLFPRFSARVRACVRG